MMTETEDWRRTNEDRLSTGSNSDAEIPGSESTLLRMPNVRSVGHYQSSRQKAGITALAFTVLLIVSIVFGVLYFSNGNENESHIQKRAAPLPDEEVVINEINDDDLMPNDQPYSQPIIRQRNSNSTSSSSSSNARATRRRQNRNRNRSGTNHGPRKLPSNAQDYESAFSLLYPLKLVKGRHESFVKYIKCTEFDVDRKQFFRGWKAVLPVNLTAAGFPQSYQHIFTGYGTKQSDARRRAAEFALTMLYPELKYAHKDDLKEIDEFCVEEDTKSSSTTASIATTPANATAS